MALVVVLNDGETYTSIDGCVVLEVPDDLLESPDLDTYVSEHYNKGKQVQ
jgi:hypothetical protein